MSKICPKCGSELSEAATICAACGAKADAVPDVDNSDAIKRMLNTGEESVVVETDELNEEQMDAFNSGKAVEFSPANPGEPNVVELSMEAGEAISAMDSMKFDDILPPEPKDDSDSEHDDDEPHDDDDIIIKRGVTEIKKFRIPHRVKKAIFICCVLAVTFAAGFALHFAITLGVFDDYADNIGTSSVRVVRSRLPDGYSFTAFDIYVKRNVDVTECIIFGVIYSEVGEYNPTYYRLLINNNDRSDSQLIRPFDREEHDMLAVSEDPNERLRAAHMMNFYENYRRSVSEIISGSSRWVRADIANVTSRLGD
jgi:hypothetical protein